MRTIIIIALMLIVFFLLSKKKKVQTSALANTSGSELGDLLLQQARKIAMPTTAGEELKQLITENLAVKISKSNADPDQLDNRKFQTSVKEIESVIDGNNEFDIAKMVINRSILFPEAKIGGCPQEIITT